jgi:hypothetical protein
VAKPARNGAAQEAQQEDIGPKLTAILVRPHEFYRGHTEDLKRRLEEHNAGKCPHTSKIRPWRVKFYAAFESLELAQQFEKYLKSGSGHEFGKHHFGL